VIALRAAKEAGVKVPSEAFDRALKYLHKLQNEDGGFQYTAGGGGSAFPRSAAAAAALDAAGARRGPEAEKARKYLEKFAPSEGVSAAPFFLYGHYYSVQTMCTTDDPASKEWYKAVVDDLAKRQKANGAWEDVPVGTEYGTATACIILLWPQDPRF
jgi:hypothetical protein